VLLGGRCRYLLLLLLLPLLLLLLIQWGWMRVRVRVRGWRVWVLGMARVWVWGRSMRLGKMKRRMRRLWIGRVRMLGLRIEG